MVSQRKWTIGEVRLLQEEYNKGTKTANIAEILDRTGDSVRLKASRLGLKHPYGWTEDQEMLLRNEYAKGTSLSVLEKMLNKSQATIGSKAVKLGIKHPRLRFGDELVKYDNYRQALIHLLQKEPHCVTCGISDFLTLNHKIPTGKLYRSNDDEYRYWMDRPEEAKKELEVMCMNCNKLHYYDYAGLATDPLRKRVLQRIAKAHARTTTCFQCGYDEDIRVLEVDHIIRDDYRGRQLYWHVLRMDLDEIRVCYQILCTNHNLWK